MRQACWVAAVCKKTCCVRAHRMVLRGRQTSMGAGQVACLVGDSPCEGMPAVPAAPAVQKHRMDLEEMLQYASHELEPQVGNV